jgi:hypothetical protein
MAAATRSPWQRSFDVRAAVSCSPFTSTRMTASWTLARAQRDEAALTGRLRADLETELARACVPGRAIVVTENFPATALHTIAARHDA